MAGPQPETSTDSVQQDRRWQEFVHGLGRRPQVPFEEQWAFFQANFAARREEDAPPKVWQPEEAQVATSNLGRFIQERDFAGYDQLHRWSVDHKPSFWRAVLERLGIVMARPPQAVLDLTEGVEDPRWLAGARMNCVDSCFKANRGKAAVVSGREGSEELRVTTYGELEELVNRVANGLGEHGFQAGDAVALYMPMTLECVAAYLGLVRAGCPVVSIADSFSPLEVRRRLDIADARGVVTVEAYQRGGRRIELYSKVREADAPRTVVLPQEPQDDGERLDLRAGDLGWNELLSSRLTFDSTPQDPYEVTNILFSSGTTGTPKAIPWTHLTPLKSAMDGHFHQDVQAHDVVAWPTNIGWMMGPWLIYATLINDATMALYEGLPTGPGFARFIAQARVSVLGVVPSLVRGWRTSGALDDADWSHVRVLSSTGEPSSREDYLWLMSRTGYRAPIIEYLGGTEIGGGHLAGTVVQPASPSTFTTPALGVDFVLLDEEGKALPESSRQAGGELYLVPPALGLSQTLLNKDHHQVYYAGCPPGPKGEVLRRHGDTIARLPGGYYKAQGRADDTMNLGGIKVSSLELERVLDDHPAIYESAAVAVQPEGEGAEKLVVYVLLDPGGQKSRDAQSLRRELASLIAERLNPLFKVHDLVIADELPRTASNKLMRRTLRARYLERGQGDWK